MQRFVALSHLSNSYLLIFLILPIMEFSKALNKKPLLVVVMTILITLFMAFSVYDQNVQQSDKNFPSNSQAIMVGMPRFILAASHEPGGYEIKAECIDAQYKDCLSNLQGVLKYSWGVKYSNREIRWLETDAPNLKIDLRGQNEKVIVFLEVIDALGNKSALQHIEINSQDVYVAENQNLYIDAQGVLYKENKTKYLYNSARLYISYRANIPEKYKEREWMATTAMVLRPISVSNVIDARSGGPLIKNILPVDELDYIKNNSTDNQVYRYTLILLNYNSRAIQFIPVTFTYVTNI